jgi:hypothetical protein
LNLLKSKWLQESGSKHFIDSDTVLCIGLPYITELQNSTLTLSSRNYIPVKGVRSWTLHPYKPTDLTIGNSFNSSLCMVPSLCNLRKIITWKLMGFLIPSKKKSMVLFFYEFNESVWKKLALITVTLYFIKRITDGSVVALIPRFVTYYLTLLKSTEFASWRKSLLTIRTQQCMLQSEKWLHSVKFTRHYTITSSNTLWM